MNGTRIGLAILALLVAACGDDDGQGTNNNNNNNNGTAPVCGNGVLEQGEQCDLGDANSDVDPDGCRTDCRAAHCGDGVIDSGEACDDGNNSNEDGCLSACLGTADCCVMNVCGDGYVNLSDEGSGPAEACDDGNQADGDDCRSDCRQDLTLCGNGDLDPGETCDDGAAANSDTLPDACRTTCQVPGCGDGVIDVLHGETCDGTNLAGQTCGGLDNMLGNGVLACHPTTCDFDTSQCLQYECQPGETRECYPAGQAGCTFNGTTWQCLGQCHTGMETCNGFWSGQCDDTVIPAPAELCDGIDNDCDGQVDECADPNPCQVGPQQVTACISDLWVTTCLPGWVDVDGLPGNGCEECDHAPQPENCSDGIDNDCNGAVDCDDNACTNDPAC